MAEEVESHTLRLLQEMRGDMRSLDAKFEVMNERITDLVQRIDGNTLTFNLVAGVVYVHEARISNLEQDRG